MIFALFKSRVVRVTSLPQINQNSDTKDSFLQTFRKQVKSFLKGFLGKILLKEMYVTGLPTSSARLLISQMNLLVNIFIFKLVKHRFETKTANAKNA